MNKTSKITVFALCLLSVSQSTSAQDWWKPYSDGATERERVFEFTQKPVCKYLGDDNYGISFGVKGFCDATVSIVDDTGKIIRHLASGVLGKNAPKPFQKNSKSQIVIWNGKDDLGAYVKRPEKMSIRVGLGLKPTFDKLLAWHEKDLIGQIFGLGADQSGVYVISGANSQLRRFDRDGNYKATVFPPPANTPIEKLKGFETLEIEPGKKVFHTQTGHGNQSSVSSTGNYLSGIFDPRERTRQQIAVFKGWLAYALCGQVTEVWLRRINLKDGSSDNHSYSWKRLSRRAGKGESPGSYYNSGEFAKSPPKIASSPDGKWLYLSAMSRGRSKSMVYRLNTQDREHLGPKPFYGFEEKVGSDGKHFNDAQGIACDSKGNIYVCDNLNNRIQILSPEAKLIGSIKIDRPFLIRIHPKTDALYVMHSVRKGRGSSWRLAKFKNKDSKNPAAEIQFPITTRDEPLMVLDAWGKAPRIWVSILKEQLKIFEEKGGAFKQIRDLRKEADQHPHPRKTIYKSGGQDFQKVSADPMREQVYFKNSDVYDLKTGKYLHRFQISPPDEVCFDRRGYMHIRFWKYLKGVGRVDPDQGNIKDGAVSFPEVPYDYGVQGARGWKGVLDTLNINPGIGKYQQGMAVNMQGDVNVECDIHYVPKMEDSVKDKYPTRRLGTGSEFSYTSFLRKTQDAMKRGAQVYFVKRKPGRILAGATYWVFASSGELFKEDIVPGLGHCNGAGIDEDRSVYLVFNSTKMVGDKAFLAGRSYVIGSGARAMHAHTGTLLKAPATGAEVLSSSSPIKMSPPPPRKPDLAGAGWGPVSTAQTGWATGDGAKRWVERVEWLYAGASPIVSTGCICPNLRIHTDWYKRTFVPEGYRHGVGVVDTNGNLIMHIGRYGNADSGRGPNSPVKVGGDEIAFAHVHYVTATDNYAVMSDLGNERLVVLKLNYYTEETVGIMGK